jgi:hypothetical protein
MLNLVMGDFCGISSEPGYAQCDESGKMSAPHFGYEDKGEVWLELHPSVFEKFKGEKRTIEVGGVPIETRGRVWW